MRSLAILVMSVALVGCGGVDGDEGTDDTGTIDQEARAVPPTGKNIGTLVNASNHTRSKIEYRKGQVMVATSNVYYIWYGNWAGNSAQTILTDFATSLGGSAYFATNTKYTNASGQAPSGGLLFGGAVEDLYSHGSSLTDGDIADVVAQQLASGALPVDSRGIYVVLASADVTATSGFCTAYCGFHSYSTLSGSQIKYVFVGNGDRCPSACAPQLVSPNGNAGADAMANVLANELSNTVTDPVFSAYWDRDGFEAADKCAWTFGATYATANGAQANVRLGTRDYLLQRNWVPTSRGGVCALNLASAAEAISRGEDILR